MKYFVLGAMAAVSCTACPCSTAPQVLWISGKCSRPVLGQVKHQVLVFGLVFVVAGLAFKLGVVPFHMVLMCTKVLPAITLMIGSAPSWLPYRHALAGDGLLRWPSIGSKCWRCSPSARC
jgi:NADH-quinone oxidoreductase subunit N